MSVAREGSTERLLNKTSPIIHPIKNTEASASVFFMECMETRKAVKKQSGGLFLGRGRVPQLSDASGTDVDES